MESDPEQCSALNTPLRNLAPMSPMGSSADVPTRSRQVGCTFSSGPEQRRFHDLNGAADEEESKRPGSDGSARLCVRDSHQAPQLNFPPIKRPLAPLARPSDQSKTATRFEPSPGCPTSDSPK